MDPRTKILVGGALFLCALAIPGVAAKAVLVLALAAGWFAVGLSARRLAVTVLSLSFFFAMTFVLRAVIQADLYPVRVPVLGIEVAPAGAWQALSLSLQIIAVVLSLAIVVYSTEPIFLAEATEILLSPAKRIGAPIHEAAVMFSIAIRFLPIMTEEFSRLALAQSIRGASTTRGGLLRRLGGVLPLLIPLFIVTLTRAKELSEAMESRGYAGGSGRTRIRAYSFTRVDLFCGLAALAVVGVSLALALRIGA